MSAWDGWVSDMIAGLQLEDTGDNRNFLIEWELYDPSPCKFNPLIASQTRKGSTNCKKLTASRTAQAYTTHASAIAGTRTQFRSNAYPTLQAATSGGHPLDYKPIADLVAELRKWGASGYADKIAAQFGVGGGGGAAKTPAHVTTAWARWMRTLGHTGPTSHNRIAKSTARVRRLSR